MLSRRKSTKPVSLSDKTASSKSLQGKFVGDTTFPNGGIRGYGNPDTSTTATTSPPAAVSGPLL